MNDAVNLKLYRRRYIPNELTHLKDDRILQYEPGKLLITEWKTLKPRKDFACGISAYFLDQGIKLSKLFDHNGNLTRWYCDIGRFHLNSEDASLTFEDLLFDVVISKDGSYRVLDIGEAVEAYQRNLITEEQLLYGMNVLDTLLMLIHNGKFCELQRIIDQACSLF